MSSSICTQPGYDEGPDYTGGKSNGYFCELDGDHEGAHSWETDLDEFATWPVKEPA